MCATTAIPSLLNEPETPVRVGELGPNFAACNARGAVRERGAAAPVPVRAAPFDQAGEIDRLDPGADFFICTRTQDERWFGIVYDAGGRASRALRSRRAGGRAARLSRALRRRLGAVRAGPAGLGRAARTARAGRAARADFRLGSTIRPVARATHRCSAA